mgnify:CR=1 FL=1|jgi:hypothetical protein
MAVKIFQYIEMMNRMHLLITQQETGNPNELAKTLETNLGQMYSILEELRSTGASIAYSTKKCSYYYARPFEFDISINYGELQPFELRVIRGGGILSKRRLFGYFSYPRSIF